MNRMNITENDEWQELANEHFNSGKSLLSFEAGAKAAQTILQAEFDKFLIRFVIWKDRNYKQVNGGYIEKGETEGYTHSITGLLQLFRERDKK